MMNEYLVGWLKSMRATCKTAQIFVVRIMWVYQDDIINCDKIIPFGGGKETEISNAFNKYQNEAIPKDTRAHLINLGETVRWGVTGSQDNRPSWCAMDGWHAGEYSFEYESTYWYCKEGWRLGQLGAHLAAAIVSLLQPSNTWTLVYYLCFGCFLDNYRQNWIQI